MRLGVDVGGTFTDAVLLDGSEIHTAKAPTTPEDQSSGVIAAVEAVLERAGRKPSDVEQFGHGMTVGTNALLERQGARTALVATEGFTDLLEVARQDRLSLYRLCADRPPPLADPELRVGVRERIGPSGVIEPLTGEELERVVAAVGELDPESVAVCLLFSYLDASHEHRIAEALREAYPELHVSASAEVLPRFREYERCSTTVIDAYLSPLLGRYLRELGSRSGELGLPEPTVMRSSGGLATLEEAGGGAAWSVLSGPAAGAVGAAALAELSGAPDSLGFDMGGTSCDVCVIREGEVRRTAGRTLGERPIQLPMVDIHTVGAGGGSIGWADAGGALRVGPRSAGADPGPASYGRGGREPTVTDANLIVGYLGEGAALAGGIELDADAAREAVAGLADELGIGEIEAAEGIVRVANQEMVGALRVVTVARGTDPRGFALLSFGGAGGLHAAAIAAELEIERIVCPRAAGVLSAVGLTVSERRRDLARTLPHGEDAPRGERLAEQVRALAEEAGEGLGGGHSVEVVYEMRYRGQSFELDVEGELRPDLGRLSEDFAAEHERRYGYRDPDAHVELVGVRVAASEPAGDLRPRPGAGELSRSSRRARFGGEWVETEVIAGEPPAGTELSGPAVLELPETTLVVPPGARAEVDEHGTIDVRLGAGR
jgi:N-methylhydantoinase A